MFLEKMVAVEMVSVRFLWSGAKSNLAPCGYWTWPAIFCCCWQPGPKAWNSLPSELRCIAVDSTFRRLGLTTLHCISARLLVSRFLTLSFYSLLLHNYFIVLLLSASVYYL